LEVEGFEVVLNEVEVVLGVPAVAFAGDDGAGQHVVLEHVVEADGHGAQGDDEARRRARAMRKMSRTGDFFATNFTNFSKD
jgi:hypothetical protein